MLPTAGDSVLDGERNALRRLGGQCRGRKAGLGHFLGQLSSVSVFFLMMKTKTQFPISFKLILKRGHQSEVLKKHGEGAVSCSVCSVAWLISGKEGWSPGQKPTLWPAHSAGHYGARGMNISYTLIFSSRSLNLCSSLLYFPTS